MNHRHCSCCEREFTADSEQVLIKDGNKIIFIHDECVPLMSGGVELSEIGQKCGVEVVGRGSINHLDTWRVVRLDNGDYHNDYGPAIEWADGFKLWFVNGKCHREDGPAVECKHREDEYWLDDEEISWFTWKMRTMFRKKGGAR